MKIVRSSDINLDKWDHLVQSDKEQRIFGWSVMKSAFSNWDAIVVDDYRAAIALPKKRKWGIPYIIQPSFIQYQSFWGDWSEEMKASAIALLKKKHLKGTFNVNDPIVADQQKVEHRPNLILPLNQPYSALYDAYSKDLKKTLNKNLPDNFRIAEEENIDLTITLYQQAYGKINPNLTPIVYKRLGEFLTLCFSQNKAVNYVAYLGDVAVASIILLKSNGRLHYSLGAPNSLGRKHKAIMRLLDHAVKEYAASSYIFDFEGSKIPSVAKVYRSYGALEESFYTLTW